MKRLGEPIDLRHRLRRLRVWEQNLFYDFLPVPYGFSCASMENLQDTIVQISVSHIAKLKTKCQIFYLSALFGNLSATAFWMSFVSAVWSGIVVFMPLAIVGELCATIKYVTARVPSLRRSKIFRGKGASLENGGYFGGSETSSSDARSSNMVIIINRTSRGAVIGNVVFSQRAAFSSKLSHLVRKLSHHAWLKINSKGEVLNVGEIRTGIAGIDKSVRAKSMSSVFERGGRILGTNRGDLPEWSNFGSGRITLP